jgi:hypothetical protein
MDGSKAFLEASCRPRLHLLAGRLPMDFADDFVEPVGVEIRLAEEPRPGEIPKKHIPVAIPAAFGVLVKDMAYVVRHGYHVLAMTFLNNIVVQREFLPRMSWLDS